jgi:hypothetical protein
LRPVAVALAVTVTVTLTAPARAQEPLHEPTHLVVPDEGPLRIEEEPTPPAEQVQVHLRAGGAGVRLFQTVTASQNTFVSVGPHLTVRITHTIGRNLLECVEPCGATVDRRGDYVVRGAGIVDSRIFSLPRDAAEVTLAVRPGPSWLRYLGTGMLGVAGAVAVVGSALLIKSALLAGELANASGNPWGVPPTQAEVDGFRYAGIGLLVGSVALAVGGIVTIVANRTIVDVRPGAPLARVRLVPGGLVF